MADTFRFDLEFQDSILAHFVADPANFTCFGEILKPAYFEGAQSTIVAYALLGYVKQYGKSPAWPTLKQLATEQNRKLKLAEDDEVDRYIAKLREMDATDSKYIVTKVTSFARERATTGAIRQAIEMIKEGKTPEDGFVKLFQDALQVGQNVDDLGLLFHADYAEVIRKITSMTYGTMTGYPQWDRIWKRGWGPGWLIVLLAPPKRYKCLGPDTPVLMFDGSTRSAKDVKVGDQVMGDDSTPRNVLSAGYGSGSMFRIKQKNGEDFLCNDAHILCLRNETGRDRLIEAERLHQLRSTGKSSKRSWQGYKTGVEFPTKKIDIDPYFLGLWLGDGRSTGPSVAVSHSDPEILRYLEKFRDSLGYFSRIDDGDGCIGFHIKRNQTKKTCESNELTVALRKMDLLQNKHIPKSYLVNDRETRLQLLAGLIDSDGSNAVKRGFIFVNCNERLARDALWLARSLGFRTKFGEFPTSIPGRNFVGTSWRVQISGKISQIPTKVKRKQASDTKKHKTHNYKIEVEPVGNGQYYGFELDGNHKFLLGDFTVTHNTAMCANLALNIISPIVQGDVLYYSCEIIQELAFARCLTNITKKPMDYLYANPEKFIDATNEAMLTMAAGNLIIKGYPAGTATITTLKNHARLAVQRFGIKKLKAIVIDYADTVQPTEKFDAEYLRQAAVYTEARAFGAEFGCPVIMPDRMTREATDKTVPDMKAFQGAYAKGGIVDVAIGLCATDEEYHEKIIRSFVFVNRHGPAFQHYRGKVDPEVMTIDIGEEIPYDPDEDSGVRVRKPKKQGRLTEDDIHKLEP
jgi:Hom_end-associated Hint